jgi:heptosyltransferase-1
VTLSEDHNIMIIRLSAMGDIIIASLLLPALKTQYPKASITWLVEDRFADLLKTNAYIDRLIVWPRQRWKRYLKNRQYLVLLQEAKQLIQEIRAQKIDLCLDTQGLLKSAIWAWLSGAPRRLGLGSKEGSSWLMTEVISRQTDNKQLGTEYIKLAQHLGLNCTDYPSGLHTDYSAEIKNILEQHQLQAGYIALCPFTTRPQKHWLDDRWSELIDVLSSLCPEKIVVLGSPADQERSEKIIHPTRHPVVNLTGQTSLIQAIGLASNARLLVGVDTGLTHLAVAAGKPALALFGATRPYLNTPSPKAKVIYNPHDCSPCRRTPSCNNAFYCMSSITIQQITPIIKDLLEK